MREEIRDVAGMKLDERMIEAFVVKLRALAERDLDAAVDVVEVILASFRGDKKSDAFEVARTLCEILEPQRLGVIEWFACKNCNTALDKEYEKKSGLCTGCGLFEPGV